MATAKEIYEGINQYASIPAEKLINWDCHHGILLGILTQAVKSVLPAEKSYRLIIGYFYGNKSVSVIPMSSKTLSKSQWYGLNRWIYGGNIYIRPEFSDEAKNIANRILTSITVGVSIQETLKGELAYWAQMELGGEITKVHREIE